MLARWIVFIVFIVFFLGRIQYLLMISLAIMLFITDMGSYIGME